VLVGGFGTRLRPLTYSLPKQMLPILDRPMIEHVIEHLGAHGVTEAVLSLGYKPDAFVLAYPDGTCAGVELHYAVEPEPLDTAGAIRFAAEHAGITERFVVVNGDVLTDLDVTALMAFHDARGAEGTIALHPVDDPSAFGVVPTEPDGRVIAFVEKPPPGEAPTNLINAGTYVLEPSVLGRIETGRKVSIEREVFPAMVADGCLYAMADDSYWIDTPTSTSRRSSTSSTVAASPGLRASIPAPRSPPTRWSTTASSVRTSSSDPVPSCATRRCSRARPWAPAPPSWAPSWVPTRRSATVPRSSTSP